MSRPCDPAPWFAVMAVSYDGKLDPNAYDVVAADGQKVARGYWGGKLNMYLAAAAPELAAALEAILDARESGTFGADGNCGFTLAAAALRKARGE